jgi:hypothetical protein
MFLGESRLVMRNNSAVKEGGELVFPALFLLLEPPLLMRALWRGLQAPCFWRTCPASPGTVSPALATSSTAQTIHLCLSGSAFRPAGAARGSLHVFLGQPRELGRGHLRWHGHVCRTGEQSLPMIHLACRVIRDVSLPSLLTPSCVLACACHSVSALPLLLAAVAILGHVRVLLRRWFYQHVHSRQPRAVRRRRCLPGPLARQQVLHVPGERAGHRSHVQA